MKNDTLKEFGHEIARARPEVDSEFQNQLFSKLLTEKISGSNNSYINDNFKFSNITLMRYLGLFIFVIAAIVIGANTRVAKFMVSASDECGFSISCYADSWTTYNKYRAELKKIEYDGGYTFTAESAIMTKESCEELVHDMEGSLQNSSADSVQYLLPSGHKTSCDRRLDEGREVWSLSTDDLDDFESDLYEILLFSTDYDDLDPIIANDVWTTEGTELENVNRQKMTECIESYGGVFNERFDGYDYFLLQDNSRIALSFSGKLLQIIGEDGMGISVNSEEFQSLISHLRSTCK